MNHIAQIQLDEGQWIQYQPWFWIKNYTPKDYNYNASTGVLVLLNDQVITDFYNHHPNLPFETVVAERLQ